jgi:hypothetical protein
MRRKLLYSFTSTNTAGNAVVVATDQLTGLCYTLRVPMEKLYKSEVSYILDTEDWDAEEDDGYYGRDYTMTEFLEGDSPKLISWWVQFLSPNRTRLNVRRKLWLRKVSALLTGITASVYWLLRKR